MSVNLLTHHVPTSCVCQLCHCQRATTIHCLIFYQEARLLWKKSGFWILLKRSQWESFLDCGIFMSKSLCREEFELFVMLWVCGMIFVREFMTIPTSRKQWI